MNEDPKLVQSLLDLDADEPVPPEHLARIRAGLAGHLGVPSGHGPAVRAAARAVSAKVAALAVGGAVIVAGAAGFALGRATAPAAPAAPASVSSAEARTPATAAVPPSEPVPSASAPVSASAASEPSSAPSSAVRSAAPRATAADEVPPAPSFDREQSLLERARAALARHDADAADRALTSAAEEFPRGKHVEEREYLVVLSLEQRGDHPAARARAKAFLASYPNSLMRARVEAIAR